MPHAQLLPNGNNAAATFAAQIPNTANATTAAITAINNIPHAQPVPNGYNAAAISAAQPVSNITHHSNAQRIATSSLRYISASNPTIITNASPANTASSISRPRTQFHINEGSNRNTTGITITSDTIIRPPNGVPSNNLVNTKLTLAVARPVADDKWFYITPFMPYESEENIVNYVSTQTNCDPNFIRCSKLARPDSSRRPLSFLSFKLNVPDNAEKSILSDGFWPEGVSISPFLNRNLNRYNQITAQQDHQASSTTTPNFYQRTRPRRPPRLFYYQQQIPMPSARTPIQQLPPQLYQQIPTPTQTHSYTTNRA